MIRISKNIYEKIKCEAGRTFPVECCGYIAEDSEYVTDIYPLSNIDNSSEHFSMSPEEQIKVIRDVRGKGLIIKGVYHSHPYTPARPSDEDIKLAKDPDVSYLIISVKDNYELKSFKIIDGHVTGEEIEVVE